MDGGNADFAGAKICQANKVVTPKLRILRLQAGSYN
jgi:hypothetical protein